MENTKPETKTELRKVPITISAEEGLLRMLAATNQGFSGGKIGKIELLSWIVLYFEKATFLQVKEEIRKAYFDKVAYLREVMAQLKKAEKEGAPEPDWDVVLAPLSKRKLPAQK